jgi:hypothetical protein
MGLELFRMLTVVDAIGVIIVAYFVQIGHIWEIFVD